MAPARASRLARSAASALEATGTRSARGRCRLSQAWHCASDCACEYTRVLGDRRDVREEVLPDPQPDFAADG
jgi:hypothetical protein